jgi:hypothetical protein
VADCCEHGDKTSGSIKDGYSMELVSVTLMHCDVYTYVQGTRCFHVGSLSSKEARYNALL